MYFLYTDYDAGLDSFGEVRMIYMPDPAGMRAWCKREGFESLSFATFHKFLTERYILAGVEGTAYDACQLCKRLERFTRRGHHKHIIKFAGVFEQDTKRAALRAARVAKARAVMGETAPDER